MFCPRQYELGTLRSLRVVTRRSASGPLAGPRDHWPTAMRDRVIGVERVAARGAHGISGSRRTEICRLLIRQPWGVRRNTSSYVPLPTDPSRCTPRNLDRAVTSAPAQLTNDVGNQMRDGVLVAEAL